MIKHGSSFFISLLLHTVILSLLFYSWKNAQVFHHKESEKKVSVNLCCVVEKKVTPIVKKVDIPKEKQKIVKKKIKKVVHVSKKVKEKTIPTPVVKQKIIPQKAIIQEMPKEEPIKELVEEKILEAVPYEDVQKEEVQIEEVQTRKKSVQQEYIDENIQKIVKLLSQNLYYPRSARRRGITGEVVVKFRLSTEAKVNFIEVIRSKSDILSRAAVKTIENLSGKFPKPNEELVLEVPINYNLKNVQ